VFGSVPVACVDGAVVAVPEDVEPELPDEPLPLLDLDEPEPDEPDEPDVCGACVSGWAPESEFEPDDLLPEEPEPDEPLPPNGSSYCWSPAPPLD
jgi:hypothetical protein